MLKKSADSVSDFKVIGDGKFRRVSVLGMGWEGYTLYATTYEIVTDDELCKMAHYFYNLGRQHGLDSVHAEKKDSVEQYYLF
jgi:hypothetical protein